jgi:hypothetical protein
MQIFSNLKKNPNFETLLVPRILDKEQLYQYNLASNILTRSTQGSEEDRKEL